MGTKQHELLEVNSDMFVVALSTNHQLAARTSISLPELTKENFTMFDKCTIVHKLVVDACRKDGFEPSNFYASHESILRLVASQAGVALIMEKIFRITSILM